jgi:hypothetical protein
LWSRTGLPFTPSPGRELVALNLRTPPVPRVQPSAMSLVDIVTLDDTWSDIHATPAVLNPLVGRRHTGDAMTIITCVTTPHESLDHTVNYVWHLLETMFSPNVCPFQTFLRAIRRRRSNHILEISAAQHGPSGKGRSRHHR